jgi:hypothetical protein
MSVTYISPQLRRAVIDAVAYQPHRLTDAEIALVDGRSESGS